MIDAIRVVGLAEFNRSLRKLDSDLPKGLRLALNEAVSVVADAARSEVPKRSGRAQASIRTQSTRTVARVKAGGKRAPYYPWLDFGGRVGRRRSIERPFFKHGRYLYAAYYEKRDSGEFERKLSQVLTDMAHQAGFEVS